MGINISIYSKSMKEHPTWDWTRYAGDKEISNILAEVGEETYDLKTDYVGEFIFRPTDVETFRSALLSHFDYNHERWNEMCNILNSGDWWLRFSC